MDFVEHTSSGPSPTLHGTVLASLSAFKGLLTALDNVPDDASKPQSTEKIRIWEGYSRLKLWAEESDAISLPEEQESLDRVLQAEDKIRSALLDILTQLQNLLRMATDIVESPDKELDLESSISGMSSSEGTSAGSPSYLEPSTHRVGTRISKLSIIISHIASKVGLLFQMSNVIRNLQPGHSSLKPLQAADEHELQANLPGKKEGASASQLQAESPPESSKSRAKAATIVQPPRIQSESTTALPHNESYPKRISNAIEQRQRALLQADISLIRTTEYISMEEWPRNVMAGVDWSLSVRRETPVLQAFYRQLLPLSADDPTGLGANQAGKMFHEVPERLQINSLLLHQELEQITSIQFNTMPLRMGPPYKLLSHYLTNIETRLEALQRSQHEMFATQGSRHQTNRSKATQSNSSQERRWPKHELGGDVQTETIATTIAHLECLSHFIRFDLAPLVELREDIKNQTLTHITFDNIWHLIKPGDLLVSNDGEKVQLVRAYSVTGGQRRIRNRSVEESLPKQVRGMKIATRTPFSQNEDSEDEYVESRVDATSGVGTWAPLRIDSFSMCSNGLKIGPVEVPRKIKHFAGKKNITDLDVYPLSFHGNSAGLLEQMRDRGIKYIEAFGHKGYHGLGQSLSEENIYEEIDGDVFVDPETFYRSHPSNRPRLGRLRKSRPDASETTESFFNHISALVGNEVDGKLSEEYMASIQSRLTLVKIDDFDSTDVENVALMPRLVIGFGFHARSWFILDVDDMFGISPQSNHAFDELFLPFGHKELILASVHNHMSQRHFQDSRRREIGSRVHPQKPRDIVRGKGRGLIFLLHGPPGTGKTSTAEAVAAHTGRPLYTITSRDIGFDPESVDKRLSEHTARAEKWGCILVIDEADVLIERRAFKELNQNIIVTVLLRALEYYSGLMFMTTNRVGVIDEAVQSRIHFALYYPALHRDASDKLWHVIFEQFESENEHSAVKIVFDAAELLISIRDQYDHNPTSRMNGRQIRNAAHVAIALAKEDAKRFDATSKIVKLERRHLEIVFQASTEFNKYLVDLHGGDESRRAREERWRFDDYGKLNTVDFRRGLSPQQQQPPYNPAQPRSQYLPPYNPAQHSLQPLSPYSTMQPPRDVEQSFQNQYDTTQHHIGQSMSTQHNTTPHRQYFVQHQSENA